MVQSSPSKLAGSGTKPTTPSGSVLVCGGGIAGIQASLDLSQAGFHVYLVEESPTIGGTMARLDKTFPTGDCATCIISPKLVECVRDHNIEIITMADVTSLEGGPGNFEAKVRERPRGVDAKKCTGCGECWQNCPVRNVPAEVPSYAPSRILAEQDGVFLAELLEKYRDQRAPLLSLLEDINDERGYLPRALLEALAQRLEIPLAEILRVASFYNAFSLEPVGRHVVEVCTGTACFVRGSGLLLQRLEEEIGVQAGGTDASQKFTLRTVRCIGCCALAPAMRIDGVTYGKAKLEDVPRLLERFE